MGLIQSIGDVIEQERLNKGEFPLCLTVLELGQQSSLALGKTQTQTGTYTITSPHSQAFELRQELYHCLSWVSSLPLQIMGFLSLHDRMSQFHIISLFLSLSLCICISVLLVLFLWRLINTDFGTESEVLL